MSSSSLCGARSHPPAQVCMGALPLERTPVKVAARAVEAAPLWGPVAARQAEDVLV